LLVNEFANSSSVLSSTQKTQLNKLAIKLRAGDTVSCVAYQESNAFNVVSRLTVKRSQSVCAYLLSRIKGLVASASTQMVPSSQVQITASKPIQIRGSASLLRRVMVTSKLGS
jgi:hypothetical protein